MLRAKGKGTLKHDMLLNPFAVVVAPPGNHGLPGKPGTPSEALGFHMVLVLQSLPSRFQANR